MKRKFKLIFIGILIIPILSGCTKEKMELKNNSFTVEYGNVISDKAEDYLKNDADFLKNIKVENLPKNEKDKEYPSVGEYEIILKNDNQKEVVKVSVKDTIAPEFKDLKEKYEIEYGSKMNIKQFSVTDLSKTEISLDDSKVNYKKSGTYKAVVTAKDKNGNETKKEISVVVKERKSDKKNTDSNNSSSNGKTSSSNKSGKSSNSKSSSSSSGASKGQELDSKRDENSYIDFNGGANSAWSGSGNDLEEGWQDYFK